MRVDPDRAEFHGPEGVLDAVADWTADFSEWSQSTEAIETAGDKVVARVHQVARGAASGVAVEADWWFVYTVVGGLITRFEIYPSREQALAAADGG
jgi:ketosteroid isomerase-like protein